MVVLVIGYFQSPLLCFISPHSSLTISLFTIFVTFHTPQEHEIHEVVFWFALLCPVPGATIDAQYKFAEWKKKWKNNSQPCVGVSLSCPLGCGFPERGMGYVLVTAVFLASPSTEPGMEGIGQSYRRVTVCAKIFLWADLWEPVLGFPFRKGGNGGYLWDFHKHLEGFSPGGGEHRPPILESGRWVTLLTSTLVSFVFLELPSSFQLMGLSACYSHCVGTLFSQPLEQLSHFGFCISAQGAS